MSMKVVLGYLTTTYVYHQLTHTGEIGKIGEMISKI